MIASLTQKQAEERQASFEGDLFYSFFLNLNKGENYNGMMQCRMTLKETKNIFVDFCGQKIVKVVSNGTEISQQEISDQWKNGQFTITENYLKKGANLLEIQFDNKYDTDGNGLHSSLDSDGDQFIYCQNEPYCLNRLLPIFDQPDLKARATFHFLRPNDWTIVSNTNDNLTCAVNEFKPVTDFEKRVQELCQENFQQTEKTYMRFDETDKLSTYLYCFVAGPYQVIEYDNSDGPAPVPMRIFCNKQNLPYVQKQKRDIFLYYIKGIEFYEKFFQTKFQFKKNDHVFCPEYTVGAMEYPGVITYTDRLVWKQDNPTPAQVTIRGGVIVHELAHMWFGNYVTMKWWNDLWLNESFADFARYLCQSFIDKELPFETTDSWTNMLIRKGWGYLEDKRISTHPIACVVENTSKADSIFDGITYAKGAAVLKQLYFLIGHETFSNNLKTYFEKYGWNNATLSQFLEEISKPGQNQQNNHKAYDVQNFNKDWIETAGLNEVQVQWEPAVQGKQKIVLRQSCHSKDHPKLRYNKLKLACFDKDAKIVHVQDFILENQEETQVEFENKNYSALLPNYEDWGFIKVILDKQSEQFFLNNMTKLNDTLSTLLVVRAFYDAIFDGKMKATEFVDKLIETKFLENLLGNSTLMDATMKFFSASLGFVHGRFKDEYYNKSFVEVTRLYHLTSNVNDRTMLRAKMVEYARTLKTIDMLKNLYEQNVNMNFTLNEKWNIVYKVNQSSLYTDVQKQIFTEGMKAIDNTDTGKNWLLSIEALTTDKDKIQELWKQYFSKERTLSYTKVGCSMRGFFSSLGFCYNKHQYVKQYFDSIVEVFNNDQKEFGKTVLSYAPCWKNKEFLISIYKQALDKIKPERQLFIDNIKKIISDLENKQKVDQLYEN